MKKTAKLSASVIIASLCGAFVAIADSSNVDLSLKQREIELAKMCEFYPDECIIHSHGAGNGGGNEPPYTPRKPKKVPEKPTEEL